jgi:Domain of unknown function (DUF4082)/PEP-CTERM motif
MGVKVMKISRASTGWALLVSILLMSAHAQAAPGLGVDFSSDPGPFGHSGFNLGWSFTANANVEVVGLGNWAGGVTAPPEDDGYPKPQQVGLWNSSGTLLASVYVTGNEMLVGSAPWVFESIAPVELVAGQTYVVGAQGGALYTGQVSDANFDPRITCGEDLSYDLADPESNSPLFEPNKTDGFPPSEAGWFGANVQLLSAVPEPSTWAMMLLGFAGIGVAGWRAQRKAAALAV